MKCKDCILKPFFNCSECKSQSSYKDRVIFYNKRYKEIQEDIERSCKENNLNEEEKKNMLEKVKNIIFKK